MECKTFNLMSKIGKTTSTRIYECVAEHWSRWTVKICQLNGAGINHYTEGARGTITRFEMHPRTFNHIRGRLEQSGYRFAGYNANQAGRLGSFKGITIYAADDVEFGYVRAKIRRQTIREADGSGTLINRQIPSSFGADWRF